MASQPTQTPAPKSATHSEPAPASVAAEKKDPPELSPEQAMALFKNGNRIVKAGDPPTKWMTQGRASDDTAVVQMPLTDELLDEIREGKFYRAPG